MGHQVSKDILISVGVQFTQVCVAEEHVVWASTLIGSSYNLSNSIAELLSFTSRNKDSKVRVFKVNVTPFEVGGLVESQKTSKRD